MSNITGMAIGLLIGMLFTSLYGYTGTGDYKQAIKDQHSYCQNVKAGIWPDYQKNYQNVCKK